MNTPDDMFPETQPSQGVAPAATMPVRPLYWSVRRELWENRSITMAPLIVAAVIFIGFLISAIGLPHRRSAVLLLGDAKAQPAIAEPYNVAAMMLIVTAFFVGVFYCVDALNGERRDRTILFWKSLPVSDRTTVLSKATIPFLVLPLVTFVAIVTTQLAMMLHTSLLLMTHGMSPASTWHYFNPFEQSLILLYGLIVIVTWHAPIYAWLLLVSGWARRVAILWAVLPVFAIVILEKIAFNTTRFGGFVQYRLGGGFRLAFIFNPQGTVHSISQLTPGRYVSAPGLWLGLLVAAALIAAAIRLRRYREPI